MAEEQRLARISELEALCAGQAFDHGKSIAEIMAEHIIVKEQKIAALTREVAGLRAEYDRLFGLVCAFFSAMWINKRDPSDITNRLAEEAFTALRDWWGAQLPTEQDIANVCAAVLSATTDTKETTDG